MDDSQKLLRRLSNLSFALAALSVIVPAVFVALFAYQIQNLKQNKKPAPQTETVAPGAPKDSASENELPEQAGAGTEQNEWAKIALLVLFIGPFLLLFVVLMGVVFATIFVAPVVLGWQLRTRRRYDLALAAAAVSCGYIPFGTILGGWTLTVLTREPVRALFADRASVPLSEDDALYLKLLSRFHYVVAIVDGLTCVYPLAIMAFPIMAIFGPPQKNPPPAVVLWLVGAVGAVFFLWLLAVTICTWRAGRYLKEHSHRTFCLVVAAVNCIAGPHGAILGGFTILVLSRPSVRLLFESPPATPLPIEADS